MKNNNRTEELQMDALYQHYRTMQDTTEFKITSAVDAALSQKRASEQAANASIFDEVDAELAEDERATVEAYRRFQTERRDDERVAQGIATVMQSVRPAILARAQNGVPSPSTSTGRKSWLSRLQEKFSTWTAPAGAFAMAAIGAVAIALFSTTNPGTPALGELNGVAAYSEIGDLRLSEQLGTDAISTLGFSSGLDARSAAYAAGALGGELSIAVSGNDRRRTVATLKRLELLTQTAPSLADSGILVPAMRRLQSAVGDAATDRLLEDASVKSGLSEVLSNIQNASAVSGTTDLTLLGSWTALTTTLVSAATETGADPRLTRLLERAVSNASDLHQRLSKAPELSDGQRRAIDSFLSADRNLSDPAVLRQMESAIRDIDTSFRV